MTPISLIVPALMVYSVSGRIKDNTRHNEGSSVTDSLNRNTAQLCGIKVFENIYRNSRIRFTDDDIIDDDVDGDSDLDKILGGSYVSYGDVPWIANIYFVQQRGCGGVIIAEYWVLSAAHCFNALMKDYYRIVVGDHVLHRVDTGEVSFGVEAIFIHEKFEDEKSDFDLALIKIAPTKDGRGIQFTNYVQPICLPDSTDTLPLETLLTVSGWGVYTYGKNDSSPVLKKASLPIMSLKDCKQYYPDDWVTPNMICAGYTDSNTKSCHGDSGGPGAFTMRGASYLFGIISFGHCWSDHFPTVFINIAMFRNWITSKINSNRPESQNYLPRRRAERSPLRPSYDSDYSISLVPYNGQNTGR